MHGWTRVALIAGPVYALACAPSASTTKSDTAAMAAAPNPAAVKAAVDSLNEKQKAAFKAKDTVGVAGNYAADAIVFSPNEPAWKGLDAIRKGLAGMAGMIQDFDFKQEEFETSGDLAVESGTYTMSVKPPKGAAMKDEGKYVTVWKKQADGSWKIIRDILNTNLPSKG